MTEHKSLKDLLTPSDTQEMERSSFGVKRMRNYFLAGVLVTAPIAITIYLTLSFLNFIDSRVRKLLPFDNLDATQQAYAVPGLGILIAILFFILVGWFARNYLGQLLIRFSEYVFSHMPIVRTIYGALKQIFETVMATKSQAFRDVVMIEYPRKGVYSLGFLTGQTKGEVQRVTDNEVVNIFLPTTPNPTSGYLLFVPKKEVRFMDMTVEEGIKMIVSAGIITPADKAAKAIPAPEEKALSKNTHAKKPVVKTKTVKKSVAKNSTASKPNNKKT